MIKSKIAAAQFLRRFDEISRAIEETFTMVRALPSDREKELAAKPVGELLGAILCDIYYPILDLHPELRPVDLLGKLRENAQYKLMYCKHLKSEEQVLQQNILPDDTYAVLKEYEAGRRQGIFWLELCLADTEKSKGR